MRARILISLLTLLTLGTPALAAPRTAPATASAEKLARPAGDPREIVARTSGQIVSIAHKAKDQASMLADMTTVLDEMLDYDTFAERTLKGTWDTLTPDQRERFIEKFKQLIIKVYARRFKPGVQFTVTDRGPTEWKGDDKSEGDVKTVISGNKVTADVDYHFGIARVDGKPQWRASDIVIDGVSMMFNWRAQFRSVIQKRGFDALLEKIDKRIQQDD
ncbi:MAG: ABC transporter substrate-binding protein [Deltaproteobacteria bacterium]|nr:ABC transporter substrate-binding protein [Deltaproteobacteria bacterium]MCB9786109.1 ABC transporter substrate-binding protein [Deltaproteobacteria bacterium]